MHLPLTVAGVLSPLAMGGKFGLKSTELVVMEFSLFLPFLLQHTHPHLDERDVKELAASLSKVDAPLRKNTTTVTL